MRDGNARLTGLTLVNEELAARFMPQFIRPENPLMPQYLTLSATVIVIDILVMWFFFALAAKSFQRFTHNAYGQKVLSRIFGVLFVAVGILLALIH